MTTFTSLLWDDGHSYILDDWLITAKVNHSDDIPRFNHLQSQLQTSLKNSDGRARYLIRRNYSSLVKQFEQRSSSLNRNDRVILESIIEIMQKELSRAGVFRESLVLLSSFPSNQWVGKVVARNATYGRGRITNAHASQYIQFYDPITNTMVQNPAGPIDTVTIKWENGYESNENAVGVAGVS